MKGNVTVQNGTVATRDNVSPVITITTPDTVSKTFAVTGTITDVGGMGTASATLTGSPSGETQNFDLPLTRIPATNTWTFSHDVIWANNETVQIAVTATDAAGNPGSASKYVDVTPVGFSDWSPTGYINAQPSVIQVFTQQMNPSTVAMTLVGPGPVTIPLGVTFFSDYAQNTSVPVLADGLWTVTATGNDTSGNPYTRPWTFTLDTSAPVITSFSIADSDGDGYIEAGEVLTLAWNVNADPNFANVSLVDNATGDVLWTSSSTSGPATTIIPVGNRDVEFRAYDLAGNYDSRSFHLYYNYAVWVNSTKAGTVSGIDTNLTAMRQLDLTAQGSVAFYNARDVLFPTFGTINRSVTNVGQVTSDTYVTVDDTANQSYPGTATYDHVWTYDPSSILDFQVQAPNIDGAVLVILEANESYLAELLNEGKSASVKYNDLVQKSAWIFIDGGYTKIEVDSDGNFSQPVVEGNPLTLAASEKIRDTLALSANQVNLNTGYRLSAQSLPDLNLPAGDYVLAAIGMDGDRIGMIEAMPFTFMNTNEVGTVPASVDRGTNFTASFATSARRVAAVVIRDATWNATVSVDASKLNRDMVHANLTYDGIPATKKLGGNIYASPNAAAYALASNTSSVSVSTDGLLAGTYGVYLVAEHENGTVQAFGAHQITVRTPGAPVAAFNMTPSTGYAPLDVNFTDESTGNINSWSWEFGDGTTSTVQNPPTHTYATAGTYLVNLTVTGYGGSDTTTQMLVVTSPVPVAIFTASQIMGTAPLTVTFTDYSTGNITDWLWKFGDGYTSSVQNPLPHTYTNAGTYTVNLTVTGPLGNDSALLTIKVNAAPSGGGGGGSSVTPTTSTGSATLLTASWGGVLKPYRIYSPEDHANLYIATGVTALLSDGKTPVRNISIVDLPADQVPAVPDGVTYSFLGYAVKCSPAGATFSPAITLTFTLTDDEWAELLEKIGGNVETLSVKWYNPLTEVWESVPTTVDAVHHTVSASISHFSIYGLFTDAAIVTPVTSVPTTPVSTTPITTAPTTPATPSGEGGFPWFWVVVIVVIIIAAVGAYYYMQRH